MPFFPIGNPDQVASLQQLKLEMSIGNLSTAEMSKIKSLTFLPPFIWKEKTCKNIMKSFESLPTGNYLFTFLSLEHS